MPHARNDLVFVSFDDYGSPEKPALVLIFGFGMSMLDWFDFGYVERLRDHFRVVTVEPRGHGASTAPTDPSAYALSAMSSDIRAVLNHLHLDRAVLWGYSLGAKMALAFAGSDPERVAGLVLGGFEPHSEVDLSGDLVADRLSEGGEAWRALWQQMVDLPTATGERLIRSNTRGLLALRQAEADWPGLAAVPAKLSVPCLLYAGENCFFRAATSALKSLFSDGRYFERQGRNHFDLMLDPAWICDQVIASFSREPHS